jgi:hypothetical protein
MEIPPISRDDLLDVLEMTQKLEAFIQRTLSDHQMSLAMSALMSSTINFIIAQCDTLEEVIIQRNVFIQIFDMSIKSIEIRDK